MSDVTLILERAQQGDPQAAEELLPLVYEELRKLAAYKLAGEASGHTLQPTALVHEAWLRLAGNAGAPWNGRGHFFAAAAEAMRRILVENVRRKRALRHGGGRERVELEGLDVPAGESEDRLLQIHEALDVLARVDARQGEIVKLRFFVGLKLDDIAVLQGTSTKTVQREWNQWRLEWCDTLTGTNPSAGSGQAAWQPLTNITLGPSPTMIQQPLDTTNRFYRGAWVP